jgi:xanthine/uracil permease
MEVFDNKINSRSIISTQMANVLPLQMVQPFHIPRVSRDTRVLFAVLEIELSFIIPSLLKKIFPPPVTRSTVTPIGVALIQNGWKDRP